MCPNTYCNLETIFELPRIHCEPPAPSGQIAAILEDLIASGCELPETKIPPIFDIGDRRPTANRTFGLSRQYARKYGIPAP